MSNPTFALRVNTLSDSSITYDVIIHDVIDCHESLIDLHPSDHAHAVALMDALLDAGLSQELHIIESSY